MALEAVVFPQGHLFGHVSKDFYSLAAAFTSFDEYKVEEEEEEEEKEKKVEIKGTSELDSCETSGLTVPEKNQNLATTTGFDSSLYYYGNWPDSSTSSILQNSSPDACQGDGFSTETCHPETTTACGRRKRRRAKSSKNMEEVETQRMTHIVVERNRRKQMNEYLAVLRSLMPPSYVQRGDQASIIGGAIDFVKELEQLLQSLEAQKRMSTQQSEAPFDGFFSFPQYSSSADCNSANEAAAENHPAMADIEVTIVESHANLKVFSKRRPKQLLKMVTGLQSLHLPILHLNVTSIGDMVLYSFSVKVEENCGLTTVDEIATAVYQMLGRIQEESSVN